VVRAGPIINITGDLFTSDDGWNASLDFGRGFREHGYLLSSRNELVVFGCNVMATLSAVLLLDLSLALETRTVLSLIIAPLCGAGVHIWAIHSSPDRAPLGATVEKERS